MNLATLIQGLPDAQLVGDGTVAVAAVRGDSRAIEPGDLFVAVRGRRTDGHGFIAQVIERGAAAVVVDHEIAGVAVPQVIVPDTSRALGVLIGRVLGDPARRMTLIGITGTNGKTTSTYLIESMLAAAGVTAGVMGTVNYRWRGVTHEAPYTTPTPETLHGALAGMATDGCTHAVMEVTSSALEMDRVIGLGFRVAAFTNLTQDHLDVHGTMEQYRAAKQRLFADHLTADGVAVVNVDDPEGAGMVTAAGAHRVLRVSIRPDADAEIKVVECESSVDGIRARITTPRGELSIRSRPLVGAYNVANLALVVGIGEALGLDHDAIARGIEAVPGVPGRVERVLNDEGLDILVDYAHTPDALRNVLGALRPLVRRRLICVFGCGGDRDPTKRPLMGAAVAELADLAIVTSDNPRTEDPRAIIDMILPAVSDPFFVDPDRRTAIRAAIAEATPGDIVLIAGKGHEDYQILGTTKIHFDDREEAAEACALRPRFPGDTTRVVIDSRVVAPGDLYVAIKGERFDGHDFCRAAVDAGARAVMIERGRRVDAGAARILEVDDTRLALGELAREHRRWWASSNGDTRLVAITGSAGKTTTKDLTAAALARGGATHAARGSLNNETGVPLTLLGLRVHHRFAVIEMGMRGVGQIAYLVGFAEPDVAAVVNAGTAHIELLRSTDAIADAKSEIYAGATIAVAPADDPRLIERARAAAAMSVTFGEGPGAAVRLAEYRATGPDGADLVIEVNGALHNVHLPLVGRHNAIDATCAIACAIAAGEPLELALAGLAHARPAHMRTEVVELGGRHVIVDCYNANPASMAAALRTLAELAGPLSDGRAHAVAVVGDMLELGEHAEAAHAEVGRLAASLDLPVVALGAWKHVVGAATGRPALAWATDDPAIAARQALAQTEPGDWILVKASRGMRLERVIDAMREIAV